MPKVRVFDFSKTLQSYEKIWKIQKFLMESLHLSRSTAYPLPDSLLLVQHPSTYTIGRGASPFKNLKFTSSSSLEKHNIFHTERGGDVTWHGPGQLVMYPILDLNRHKKDLHFYMRSLEQVVIDSLKQFGVSGERNDVNAGVWVSNKKISAVGVTASRWITMHGIALNVRCDLSYFDNIVPCGIENPAYGVSKLQEFVSEITLDDAGRSVLEAFSNVFELELVMHGENELPVHPVVGTSELRRVQAIDWESRGDDSK